MQSKFRVKANETGRKKWRCHFKLIFECQKCSFEAKLTVDMQVASEDCREAEKWRRKMSKVDGNASKVFLKTRCLHV